MQLQKIIVYVVLLTFGALLLIPFVWMLSVSFERMANVQPPFPPKLFPAQPSWFNYKIIVENGYLLRAYRNSFLVAGCSVGLSLSAALLAGYAFSKGDFPGKRVLFVLVLATMMIPIETRLIPMYLMFNAVGLVNTFWPVILPSVLYGFGIFLSKQYFDKMPDSLREAARIDGAGEFMIFFKVFAPLAGPITATLVILAFMGSWNSFIWPLIVLTDQTLQTVPIYLSTFALEDGKSYAGLTMGLAGMSILPIIIVFLFFQKYIIRSVALSGLKGE